MKAKGYLSKFVLSLSEGEAAMKSGQLQKIRRGWEFTGEIFGIALVSVLVGAMPGDGGLTARR